MKKELVISLLRNRGLKATPARIAVVQFLEKQKKPASIERILANITKLDKVTAYRIMEHLTAVGLVARHDIGHQHHDYELSVKKHHHHVICTTCNAIEDIDIANENAITKHVKSIAKKFASIDSHQISFYGVCKKCARKK